MIDYLARAMEQEEDRDRTEEMEGELPFSEGVGKGKMALGDRFSGKEAPRLPREAPEGEGVDPLPLRHSPFNHRGRGTAVPVDLDPGPGIPVDRLSAPMGHFAAPSGGGMETDLKRQDPDLGAEGQGQGLRTVGIEMPLLAAVRRAGEGASFVQSRQRAFRVTLPEAGEREAGGLTIEGMDRAVERDARRYDGGFSLY